MKKSLTALAIASAFALTAYAEPIHPEVSIDALRDVPIVTKKELIARSYQTWLNQVNVPYLNQLGAINGKNVTVGVADTGVQANHPELLGKIVASYNVFDRTSNVNDTLGHGTHVAGLIAGSLNNGLLEGVAPGANIAMAKVFNNSGSTTYDKIELGINWLANTAKTPIISLSLGGQQQMPSDALKNAVNKGVLFTIAAGNDGNNQVSWPARYASATWANNQIIVVGAVDANNRLASFSNYSRDTANWFVVAPGVNVASSYIGSQYAYMSGTSMATPIVAGQAALIKNNWNFLSANTIAQIIFRTASRLGKGTDSTPDPIYGWGLINVQKSLSYVGAVSAVVAGANISLNKASLTSGVGAAGTRSLSMMGTDIFGRGYNVDLAKTVSSTTSRASNINSLFTRIAQQDALVERVQGNNRFAVAYTSNVNGKILPSAMSFSQTLSNTNYMSLGVGSMSDKFFGLMASDLSPISFTGNNKFSAPYFSMVNGATHIGYATALSNNTSLRVGALSETPSFAYKDGAALDQSAFASRALTSIELEHRSDNTVSIITFGVLQENNSLLGSTSSNAFAFEHSPNTAFVSLSGAYALNKQFSLAAISSFGKAAGFNNNTSLVSSVASTTTWAYSLGLAGKNLWRRDDRLGVSVSMPTKIISGGMYLTGAVSQNSEDGSLNTATQFLNLHPNATEHDLEIAYSTPLNKFSKITGAVMLRQNPGHDAMMPNDFVVGTRYKLTF